MKQGLLIAILLSGSLNLCAQKQKRDQAVKFAGQFWGGFELNQLQYYFYDDPGINFAGRLRLDLHCILRVELTGGMNHVRDMSYNFYSNIRDYNCRGSFGKLGMELDVFNNRLISVGLGSRATYISMREKFIVYKENAFWYTGQYNQAYSIRSQHLLPEFTVQARLKRPAFEIKTEAYWTTMKAVQEFNHRAEPENYQTAFVPGLGYARYGVNVVLYFKL